MTCGNHPEQLRAAYLQPLSMTKGSPSDNPVSSCFIKIPIITKVNGFWVQFWDFEGLYCGLWYMGLATISTEQMWMCAIHLINVYLFRLTRIESKQFSRQGWRDGTTYIYITADRRLSCNRPHLGLRVWTTRSSHEIYLTGLWRL